jgi:hypothetical protein
MTYQFIDFICQIHYVWSPICQRCVYKDQVHFERVPRRYISTPSDISTQTGLCRS